MVSLDAQQERGDETRLDGGGLLSINATYGSGRRNLGIRDAR